MAEMTQRCWDFFEPFIRARPELWLWNYKHWRYKPQGKRTGNIRFIPRVSERFERIIAGEPVPYGHILSARSGE